MKKTIKANAKTTYKTAWDKANTTQFKIKLNNNTDLDIINWLNSTENKQGYLKELIRADIAKVNKEITDEAIGWAEKEGII